MKITKTANGKKTIKISKKEWQLIGKKAEWQKTRTFYDDFEDVGEALSLLDFCMGILHNYNGVDDFEGETYDPENAALVHNKAFKALTSMMEQLQACDFSRQNTLNIPK